MARTFELNLRRLDAADRTDQLALKILARAARLAPETPIPRALLLSALNIPEEDRQAARHAERALIKLRQLGLIRSERGVEMHRLVSGVVVRAVDDSQAGSDVENAVTSAVGRLAEAGDYQAVLTLLRHLRFLANGIGGREDLLAGHLCFVLGATLSKLLRREDYGEALSYTERAMKITEAAVGAVHFRTLRLLVNLGAIRHAMRDIDGALNVYQRALKVSKKVCGRRDPETAYVHNNLGATLRDKAFEPGQTRYARVRYLKEAHRHYKRALKIRKKTRAKNPDLAESLTNMGHLMLDLRHFPAARICLERSLQVDSEPPVPLDLRAKTLGLLGSLMQHQGHQAEAHLRFSQSFDTYERAFGFDHPVTKQAKAVMEQAQPPAP